MALILYVAKIAVDRDTGLPLPELRGQGGTIIARGNPSSIPTIYEDKAGSLVIPGSAVTINDNLFTSSFWVDEADLPIAWWDGSVEVPLESVEGIAIRLDDLEVLFDAVNTSAAQAAVDAELARAAAQSLALPSGGAAGQVLAKASAADGDYAWSTVSSGGGGGITDHNALSNLTVGDPHTQYLNQARGDARYYPRSTVDTMVNNAATQTSADDRNRANHTGTQPVTSLAATGTPSSSTYLRGDGTWATPDGGGGGGTIGMNDITDATTTGKQVLGASSAGAARSAIGAGTSNLAVGGTAGAASTAMRSDAILINPGSVPGTGTYLIARTA